MKKIIFLVNLMFSFIGLAQDLSMQDGSFNRCAPDRFFDSGGEFGNYGNNENFTTTICALNADEFIILNFTSFSTQLSQDIMTIYDGTDTTAPVLGIFSGVTSPGTISASTTNTSGCLTITFESNGAGNTIGWDAEILCAAPCQDITATIDSTNPEPNETGVVSILPGDTVDFTGSATFSVDGTNASYNWDFGDGNNDMGTDVSNTFATAGTYTVTLTVNDDNPQGCSGVETITVFVLGPNVVVDQDIFTVEELIIDVLINSECADVDPDSVTFSTGSTFDPSQPNGIGYFFSNGVDFPFEDGILLTTGDASRAGGPNVFLGDGTVGLWPGDPELDAVTGINSNNATWIQFDFTPLADNISFEFLMASEEYDMGNFECTFSDAFAFLLTDSMGNTTNLAVLPGTNTPILVTNIHLDNGFCPAQNEQYFGEYIPNNAPPISFDGRTAVFTAQSTVTPGEQYTIRLVIADDDDGNFDSGVFLRAGSFDLGGDLGEDITIDAGTAECGGSSITLDTSISTATHTWYFEGNEITDETGPTIEVTETGTYSVDIAFSDICQATDSIFVEFKPNPEINSAENLSICDTDGIAEFDLSLNDGDILGTQDPNEFMVTYHLTEQDAI
ncbi:choice-of-anchor L domain-containing protein, partial [Winogradskyella sp.]|uniref:choice-of-anchor L domain-containing protein n=1 Tax=Winogradskyella sp. TaxID=1883156 RepID=UPI0025D79EAF